MLGGVSPTRLIVSHHDFSAMPEDLDSLRLRLEGCGTGAIKVAGMAARPEDGLTALRLYESTPLAAISIAMGEHGVASRILALRPSNCLLTYCALDRGGVVAPGQTSVGAIRDVYRAESIGGATKAVGVVSRDPISDTLMSDVNAGLRDGEIDAVAVPLRIARPNETRLMALSDGGYDGFWLIDGTGGMEAAVFASFSEGTLEATPAAALDDALSAAALHLG